MSLNTTSWSESFGGYAHWRLPDFPLPTDFVNEVDSEDESLIQRLAEQIASFYHQKQVTFGYLFPRAVEVHSLDHFDFANPVANLLLREGFAHVSDLADFSTLNYLNFRGVGLGNYLSLLKSLIHMNLVLATTTALEIAIEKAFPSQVQASDGDSLDIYDFYSHILLAAQIAPGSAYEQVLEVALFSSFISGPDEPVLKLNARGNSSVSGHLDAVLGSLSARSLLGGIEPPTFQEVAMDFVQALDEKEKIVLLHRFLTENPKTLDEIGADMGVSRERIRQIAKKLQEKYEERSSREHIFRAAVTAFQHLTSEPVSLLELSVRQSGLFSKLGEVDATAFRFFAGMVDVNVDKGWIYQDRLEQQKQFAHSWTAATEGGKYTTLDALLSKLINCWPTFTEDQLKAWLADNGYVSYQGFYYNSKGASLVTVAKIVLEVEQKPMAFKALFEAIPEATSERAIRTRLLQDPDIVKSGKDSCALKVWGVPEFTTIHQELVALVRAEGSQSLDGTIRKFVDQFGVAESAVRAYANAYPLQVISGQIRLAEAQIPTPPRKRLSKNVYRRADGWSWRIVVNSEHLRGSGSQCPAFLADQLGITGGQNVEFACEEGRIAFGTSKLNQRNIGSIRDACLFVGAEVDDQILIHFSNNTAQVVKLEPSLKGESLVRALAALPSSGDLESQLSFAFNLEASKSIDELIKIASQRKETDLSEALLGMSS